MGEMKKELEGIDILYLENQISWINLQFVQNL